MKITASELLDALALAAQGTAPADARTLVELTAHTGWTERKTRAALHAMQAAGRLVVHRVTRQALDGRMARVSAYTFTEP